MVAALMLGVGVASFVIGPLRAVLSLESLYRYSCAYPLAALGVALWVLRPRRQPSRSLRATPEVQ